MTKSHFTRALVLLLLLSPTVFAAAEDLSGKWSGAFVIKEDGGNHEDTAFMVAAQKGVDLTGSIGPNEGEQYPMLKGKIETTKDGTKETTKANFDVEFNGSTIHFALALTDGHLKGEAKGEHDGQQLLASVDLTRVKK